MRKRLLRAPPNLVEQLLPVVSGGERLLHRDRREARGRMGLQLADQVEIGRDDRADHEIAAARHCVAMQHDRLGAARHLNRAIGIAGVDDVGGVGARAERRFARNEFERSAAAEAIADAVGLGRDLPGVVEEVLAALPR